ncbi:MAG: histidine kinase [Bacteroidales bacterium]|jgi:signal transduction histidine kinase|nr:histidine kinase [Bacteroidales bacterium]
MVILVALILSILLQIGASILSLGLIKRTKYNVSWILISIGFTLMAVRRVYVFVYILHTDGGLESQSITDNWLSVVISLVIFVGVIYIRKIFDLQERIDRIRKDNESRVFAAIIKTEEQERKTFAKELHDGLGPILSSIKMGLSAINQAEQQEQNKQILSKTNFAIDEAIITIKEISNRLSPHILTNFGLEKAVRNFINTISYAQITIDFKSEIGKERYDFTIETVLYRVICELLANTIQHADAEKVSVLIQKEQEHIVVSYTDNGNGFEMQQEKTRGMGLSNIYSRIQSIHGGIEIETSPGSGFKTFIRVPISSK